MGEVRRPFYTATDPKTGEKVRHQSKTWQIRYYRNGRRYEESSHSTKKGDAQRLLRLREGDIAKGIPVSSRIGQLRFEEAAADVVTDYRVNGKKTTAQVARRIRLHLEPYFGGRRMAAITTAHVRAYTAHRQGQGAANGSINRELAILKRAFRLAEQAGTLLHRPHLPMLDEENTRTGFFERDEFEAVREALPEGLRGVVTLAYLTGWRVPSEVLPLQWAQVDRKAKTVRLEPGTTKNKKGRTLPYDLLPELEQVIEDQWREHQRLAAEGTICPHVFHRNGRSIKSLRGAWTSACKAAGVPGKIPHDFRRTAARNLIRAGVSQSVAMQVTGHVTPSVFQRYDITTTEDVRKGLGKLATSAGKEKGKKSESGRVRQFPKSG